MKTKINVNVNEKNIDILSMWRDFWNTEQKEKTKEEEILSSSEITDEEKRQLLNTLKDTEKLQNVLFRNSYKTAKLKVQDYKHSAENKINSNKIEKANIKEERASKSKKIDENSIEM